MRQGKRGAICALAALALLGLTPLVVAAAPENVGYSDTVSLKLVGGGPDVFAIAAWTGVAVVALVAAVWLLPLWRRRANVRRWKKAGYDF